MLNSLDHSASENPIGIETQGISAQIDPRLLYHSASENPIGIETEWRARGKGLKSRSQRIRKPDRD